MFISNSKNGKKNENQDEEPEFDIEIAMDESKFDKLEKGEKSPKDTQKFNRSKNRFSLSLKQIFEKQHELCDDYRMCGYVYQQTNSNLRSWGLYNTSSIGLTQDTLYVYKGSKEHRALNEIECGLIYRVERISQWHKKKEFCFAIRTYGRTYIFSVNSEEESHKWVTALETSMRDCALDGVTHSFRHLLNAYRGDEMKFARIILERMQEQVPQWENIITMNTDIKRLMNKMLQDANTSQKNRRDSIELKVQSWRIDFSSLKIERKVAEGHYGEVYKARLWGKEVAVKKLKTNIKTNDLIQKLEQEAAVMSSLRHPNVLLFMGLCSEAPNVCLVMEYIEKGSIYDVLQNNVVTDKKLFKMIMDICHGMNYLHKQNILHLDLKPLNLLVDDNLTVKVCDFGLSKMLRNKEKENTAFKGGYGTILYMAPEVIYGPSFDSKADVFSFGIVLYELLYMREHSDINFTLNDSLGFDLLRAPIAKNQTPPICGWWMEIFRDLIVQCLSPDPKNRPDFDKIIQILETVNYEQQDDWFLQKIHARNMYELSKNEENHKTLLELEIWASLDSILNTSPDLTTNYFAINTIMSLYYLLDNPAEIFIRCVEVFERFTNHNLDELQKLMSEKGKFKIFQILLESIYTVISIKDRVLQIIMKLFESVSVIECFVEQGCISFFVKCIQNEQLGDVLHHKFCFILSQIANAENGQSLYKFIDDGGVDALVYLSTKSKNHRAQFCGLQALADICVKGEEFAILIHQKGIKPVQLASRAYLGALLRKKPPENENPLQNTAFRHEKEGKELYPYMSLSFYRAKDKLSNMFQPDNSAEQRYSRFFLNDNLNDEDIIAKLWEILLEEKDNLDNINTKIIKTKLEKALNIELKERKQFISYQIMKIVGQMEPPTQLNDYMYLGSEWNASNKTEMKNLGITHILNVSVESPNYFPVDFIYHNIRIKDKEFVDINNYFLEAFEFIDKVRNENKKVLVHCHMGISRSATICIAYLMNFHKWSLQKTFKYVKDLRNIVQPNRGFMRILMAYDVKLNGSSSLGTIQFGEKNEIKS